MQDFSIETLALEAKRAMAEAEDRMEAARSELESTIERVGPQPIIDALEAAIPAGADIGEMIVHQSAELTLLYARVPPRFHAGIHDHTVFALIAPLSGRELNRVYRARGDTLRKVDELMVGEGEIFGLAPDAIHSIENPDGETASALHLYGGDFRAVMKDRSLYRGADARRSAFSFEALLEESVGQMSRRGNRQGLEALAEAVPASAKTVEAALRALGASKTSADALRMG